MSDAASGGRDVGCTAPQVQWTQPAPVLLSFWAPIAGNVILWTPIRRTVFKTRSGKSVQPREAIGTNCRAGQQPHSRCASGWRL